MNKHFKTPGLVMIFLVLICTTKSAYDEEHRMNLVLETNQHEVFAASDVVDTMAEEAKEASNNDDEQQVGQDRSVTTLVMSDFDDTMICPQCTGSCDGRPPWCVEKNCVAGSDMCPDMDHGEPYPHFFAFWARIKAAHPHSMFEVVSANPNPIESADRVNAKVQPFLEKDLATRDQLRAAGIISEGEEQWWPKVDDFHGGNLVANGSHLGMAVKKLEVFVDRFRHYENVKKIVWFGDTGQGDVCAWVCFIKPQHQICQRGGAFRDALKADLFGALFRQFSSGQTWISEEYYNETWQFRERLSVTRTYAFFHTTFDVNSVRETEPWRVACTDAANEINRDRHDLYNYIHFVGPTQPAQRKKSTSHEFPYEPNVVDFDERGRLKGTHKSEYPEDQPYYQAMRMAEQDRLFE